MQEEEDGECCRLDGGQGSRIALIEGNRTGCLESLEETRRIIIFANGEVNLAKLANLGDYMIDGC